MQSWQTYTLVVPLILSSVGAIIFFIATVNSKEICNKNFQNNEVIEELEHRLSILEKNSENLKKKNGQAKIKIRDTRGFYLDVTDRNGNPQIQIKNDGTLILAGSKKILIPEIREMILAGVLKFD